MTQKFHPKSPQTKEQKKILFLDAYDSFSQNIASLLTETLSDDDYDVQVYMLHIDLTLPSSSGLCRQDGETSWPEADFLERLDTFDAVVCGPGPGNPGNYHDVGAMRLLWQEQRPIPQVPVLGICLGFQSLVGSLGGRVERLKQGLHGMVREVQHCGADIFEGVGDFRATLYHSLCMDVGQRDIPAGDWEGGTAKWISPGCCGGKVQPLAWLEEDGQRVLMAARHVDRPLWGLQYHPESVCTDTEAHKVVRNWFRQAMRWNEEQGRNTSLSTKKGWRPDGCAVASPPRSRTTGRMWEHLKLPHASEGKYAHRTVDLPAHVDAAAVVETLGLQHDQLVVLDSSNHDTNSPLARSSIVAVDVDSAPNFTFRVGDSHVRLTTTEGGTLTTSEIPCCGGEAAGVWDVLTDFWRRNPVLGLDGGDLAPCSFRGGFMGYVTYELGLSRLSPESVRRHGGERADLSFVWVTKSVVLDHEAGKMYVQCIGEEDVCRTWLDETVKTMRSARTWTCNGVEEPIPHKPTIEDLLKTLHGNTRLTFDTPDLQGYETSVTQCQEYISAGESYELCLTGETVMTRPRWQVDSIHNPHSTGAGGDSNNSTHQDNRSPWEIYQTLRTRQPAPFGSYLRLGGLTLLSSSPERFLQHDSSGRCSMRPMKGTVRKSESVRTLSDAKAILHTAKEIAENLMIVDLVRHDLHEICGPGKVQVPELLKVEEYASVFQMVTNVTAQVDSRVLTASVERGGGAEEGETLFHGLHVLGSVLPPGSMTGAPKKRSCEILRGLERRERSVYSGVVGYFDVTGQADWSVTIRAMWRWDDEGGRDGGYGHGQHGSGQEETQHDGGVEEKQGRGPAAQDREVWRIGAGGAVTALSTARGEREEMVTKLSGPLGVFRDAA